ncbi:hypothetical protein BH09MYX1_BH09MYX1_53030 [soil metagenome]
MERLNIGDVIPGTQLKIVGLLGQGGQGTVYETQHLRLLQPRVVKVLNVSALDRGDDGARILAEAQMLAAIQHPNIVPVIDAGLTTEARPRPFLVMPKLDGMTLHEYIRRKRHHGGVSVEFAIITAEQLCSALDVAHLRHQLVHRDIKPANVILVRTSANEVIAILLDFGIAKMLGVGATGRHIIGTLQYMPPEQIEGRVTARSDLYNIGLLLFEMIAGHHPFTGCQTHHEWAEAHLRRPAPRLSSIARVDRQLDQLVAQLLEKDPKRRPTGAHAVEEELRAIRQRLKRDADDAASPQAITVEMPFSAIETQMGIEATAVPRTPDMSQPTSSTAPVPSNALGAAITPRVEPSVSARLPHTTNPVAAPTAEPRREPAPVIVEPPPPTLEIAPPRRQLGRSNPPPDVGRPPIAVPAAAPAAPGSTRFVDPPSERSSSPNRVYSARPTSTTGASEIDSVSAIPKLRPLRSILIAAVAMSVAVLAVAAGVKLGAPTPSAPSATDSAVANVAPTTLPAPTAPTAPTGSTTALLPTVASATPFSPFTPTSKPIAPPPALRLTPSVVAGAASTPPAATLRGGPPPSAVGTIRRPGSGLDGPPKASASAAPVYHDPDFLRAP